MKDRKDIEWLYNELPDLVEKNVITEETSSKIKEYYGVYHSKAQSFNIVFIISAILGALLIGLGIILLFAYNWDELSRTSRTILSFLPLVIAQIVYTYAVYKKENSIGWIEGASGFLMLMIGSSIALISQTYNLGGTMEQFLFTWMILSIPLLYLRNATFPLVLYLVGITWRYLLAYDWYYSSHDHGNKLMEFWLLALAVVPNMFINIKPSSYTIRANITAWTFSLAAFFSCYRFIGFSGGLPYLFYLTCLFTLLYIVGKFSFDQTNSIWKKPFQFIGILGIFIISISGTYSEVWEDYGRGYFLWDTGHTVKDHFMDYLISILMSLVIVAGILYCKKKKKQLNLFPALFPALIGAGAMLTSNDNAMAAAIFCDIFIFAYGVYYIYQGVELGRFSLVNAGMFFVTFLIAIRFLSSDVSFVIKGIVFIVIGFGFLGVNYWLSKRLKRDE